MTAATPWISMTSAERAAIGNGSSPVPTVAALDGADHGYLRLVTASSIKMSRPRWAWRHRIPIGGTTLLAGREGMAKSLLVAHLAARWTRGDLPGDFFGHPRVVVWIGEEDDRSSVLVPRLTAAGADLDRIRFVDLPAGGAFSMSVDLLALEHELDGFDVAAIVVDPLDAHLGASVDSHRKSEVQATVSQLAQLVQKLRCASVGIAHLNKGESRDVLVKVVGSVGFTTSARSVLAVGEHPDDPADRVCVLRKSNMTSAPEVPALRFRPEGTTVEHPDAGEEPIVTAQVVIIGEESGIDANSILTVPDAEERSRTAEAAEWLDELLSEGAMRSKEVKSMALDADIAVRTLTRARLELGVIVERDEQARGRPSTWRLPIGVER